MGFYFESPEQNYSMLTRVIDSRRAFESLESDFSPGETMSAVIGTQYSPLLSFKTNSPWYNSNAGPQGWPTRWVSCRRICCQSGLIKSLFGHLAVLWHRRSRCFFFFLLRNEDFQATQLAKSRYVPLSPEWTVCCNIQPQNGAVLIFFPLIDIEHVRYCSN